MHYLSSLYFANQPLHVFGVFIAHHQVVLYMYNNWYLLFFLVDGLFSWLGFQPNQENRPSTKGNKYQLLYIYSVPPDYGL